MFHIEQPSYVRVPPWIGLCSGCVPNRQHHRHWLILVRSTAQRQPQSPGRLDGIVMPVTSLLGQSAALRAEASEANILLSQSDVRLDYVTLVRLRSGQTLAGQLGLGRPPPMSPELGRLLAGKNLAEPKEEKLGGGSAEPSLVLVLG